MKYTIGIAACIAIFFCVITSPERSQSHAHDGAEAAQHSHDEMLEQSVQQMTAAIIELQDTIADQQAAIADRTEQQVTEMVDEKLVAFTSSLPIQDTDETWAAVRDLEANVAELEKRIEALEAAKKQLAAAPVVAAYPSVSTSSGYGSSGSVSYGSTGSTAATTVTNSTYQPRWQNYDGLTKAQHAQQMHGINTAGMTAAQIAMALDADHDTYGPNHTNTMRSRSTVVSSAPASNCPGGVCPTSRTTVTQSRGGVLGFGLLGRRR